MYVDSGIAADRVHVLPNGVDLERFTPDGPPLELDAPGLRLLFVGGLTRRKGPDVLLETYRKAFAGREDVTLVIKDFGADGRLPRHDDRGGRPRVRRDRRAAARRAARGRPVGRGMAALYRACDVLVHPYRGEGFAMPVLEAMASGLPVIVTGGGPTDEFCPPEAGWRIRSERKTLPGGLVDGTVRAAPAWLLEPDADHLGRVAARGRRGRPGGARAPWPRRRRAAARALSWDAVARSYRARLDGLLAREPRAPRPARTRSSSSGDAAVRRVLATPAWHAAEDRVAELLAAWATPPPSGDARALVPAGRQPRRRHARRARRARHGDGHRRGRRPRRRRADIDLLVRRDAAATTTGSCTPRSTRTFRSTRLHRAHPLRARRDGGAPARRPGRRGVARGGPGARGSGGAAVAAGLPHDRRRLDLDLRLGLHQRADLDHGHRREVAAHDRRGRPRRSRAGAAR